MRVNKLRKLVPASMAAAALVATGLTGTAAADSASVTAAVCGWYPTDDYPGVGHGYSAAGAWYRTGPSSSCSGTKYSGTKAEQFECKTVNSAGNTWYFSYDGWVYSGNIASWIDNAPTSYC
ncbi:UNVERIFIED_ORG: hypothetical protein FHR35_004972 [Microbispora rosea subsp. rosea]